MHSPSSAINSSTVTLYILSFSLFFSVKIYGYAASYDVQMFKIDGGRITIFLIKKNVIFNIFN